MGMMVVGAGRTVPGGRLTIVPVGPDGIVVGGAIRFVDGDRDCIVVVGAGRVWVGGGKARMRSFFGGLRRISDE